MIRLAHPAVPFFLVSPVYCPIHETIPGPTSFDEAALREGRRLFRATGRAEEAVQSKLTLQAIRAQIEAIIRARRERDSLLHYVDGTSLYGEDDHTYHPLPDALHPDTASHRLIGERFVRHLMACQTELRR